MKNLVFHFTLILALIFNSTMLNGQTLDDIATNRAVDWQQKFSLSSEQTENLQEVIVQFDKAYKELILNGEVDSDEFNKSYEALIKKRDKGLADILTSQELTVFTLMENNQIEEIKDFFESSMVYFSNNQDFLYELSAYNQHSMWPVIRSVKEDFDAKMDPSDKAHLKDLSISFNAMLDAFVDETNSSFQLNKEESPKKMLKKMAKSNDEYKGTLKELKKLNRKYRIELEKVAVDLVPAQETWREDIKNMMAKKLDYAQQDELERLTTLIGAYNIQSKVNKSTFLLIDLEDDESYFTLNRKLHAVFLRVLMPEA